ELHRDLAAREVAAHDADAHPVAGLQVRGPELGRGACVELETRGGPTLHLHDATLELGPRGAELVEVALLLGEPADLDARVLAALVVEVELGRVGRDRDLELAPAVGRPSPLPGATAGHVDLHAEVRAGLDAVPSPEPHVVAPVGARSLGHEAVVEG